MVSGLEWILVGSAAVAAGAVNALAGGGTLITFPVLVAVGIPPVASNVTNTVALCPGYLGATLAQWNDLRGQKRRMALLLPSGLIGGLLGGLVLLNTGERVFTQVVPFLILLASGLLAVQEPLRAWLVRRRPGQGPGSGLTGSAHNDPAPAGSASSAPAPSEAWAAVPMGLAAVYGGFFGAGMSVIVLAVLGLTLEGTLTRLNALKQSFALVVNVAAALLFLFSGQVAWKAALVTAVGALVGGALGGRLAGRIDPARLRWIVVAIGLAVSVIYLLRI